VYVCKVFPLARLEPRHQIKYNTITLLSEDYITFFPGLFTQYIIKK